MNLDKLKENLKIDENIDENIKRYLIHENITKTVSNNKSTTNLFSNIILNLKLLNMDNLYKVYSDTLSNAKTESELISKLNVIEKKIAKKYDIDKLQDTAISSLSNSSSFYISLGNTDSAFKYINATLENNTLTYDWDYKRKEITESSIINSFKDIVLQNREELFKLSNSQKDIDKNKFRDMVIHGRMKNSLQGNIDNIPLSIYPELQESKLNASFFNVKDKIYNLLETSLPYAKEIK